MGDKLIAIGRLSRVLRALAGGPCEIAAGSRTRSGYVRISLNGRQHLAHRLAYCVASGLSADAIKGLVIRHRCDNPSCANPDHLSLGTQRQNMADARARGRSNRGRKHGNARLTDAAVSDILANCAPGRDGANLRVFAERYGVSRAAVWEITSGRNWGHLSKGGSS